MELTTQEAAHDRRKGLVFAGVSVALVSVAQLALKLGATQLTIAAPHDWSALLPTLAALLSMLLATPTALWPLVIGMACYGASMFCWLAALGRLPLNLAYPLLSLSYPLVYLGAACLPFLHETLNAQRLAGIGLIMLGVALLMGRRD